MKKTYTRPAILTVTIHTEDSLLTLSGVNNQKPTVDDKDNIFSGKTEAWGSESWAEMEE